MGRKSKKEGTICIYILFAIQQKLTQQCEAAILQQKLIKKMKPPGICSRLEAKSQGPFMHCMLALGWLHE